MRRLKHMNETISLNPRQKAIINLLAREEELSREKIADKLVNVYPVSKATLARDLAELLAKNMILIIGSGPSCVYKTVSNHPLLKYIDLKQYFAFEPDERKTALTSFNQDVFTDLKGLIFSNEKSELKAIFRSFSQVKRDGLERELERFVIELAWKSSKIEGNTYTLLETEALLQKSQETAGHPKSEAIMILNHKEAFKTIVDHRDKFKKLTSSTVLELHNVLTKGLSIESGVREQPVGITGTTYRPLDNQWQIKESLEELIKTVNSVDYPLEKALIVSSMVAYLQPFADGNKRTARMLANAILLAYDYFPLSYRSVDENEYKEAMIIFYETNNLYHVKRLFLDQYRFALKTYF